MTIEQQLAHFQRLKQLLTQEKEADFRNFLELVRESPLAKRVEEGYTWYPLQVVDSGFSLGEKAFVVVERSSRQNEPHSLRSGQPVSLFTLQPDADQPGKPGVIQYVERNRMKIILHAKDVPEWIQSGQLGVDMLFDDRSYFEMEKALDKVMAAKDNRLAELRRLFTAGDGLPMVFQLPETSSVNAALNPSQQKAVSAILHHRDIAVIHGPPGTGKTTTLVAAIETLSQTESTVLVTAPSNTAADLLTERLAIQGLNVVRIGNVSRVDESVIQHTAEALLAGHPEAKNIKKVKIAAAEYRRQAARFKRHVQAEDRRERAHLKQQARELDDWARMLEDRVMDEILSGAQAIICTLVGAAHPLLNKRHFQTCVIDEAAQALEPACWIPMAKCSRVVLAGDPFQLPPTVKNLEAARQGLSVTLIERCLELLPAHVYLLTVQYRMNQAIMAFSNHYFYGGVLQAHASAAHRTLYLNDPDAQETSVSFIDTAGCGFEEKMQEINGQLHRNPSRFNPEEAELLCNHLKGLLHRMGYPERWEVENQPDGPDIGILSPYREQVNHLEALFREDTHLAPLLTRGALAVNTIDGFQGQERDVIYISLVRSNQKHEIGFLQDYRRMNVAMTRAKMALIVIGDSATIGENKFYQQFMDYCAEHGAYRTAWEISGLQD